MSASRVNVARPVVSSFDFVSPQKAMNYCTQSTAATSLCLLLLLASGYFASRHVYHLSTAFIPVALMNYACASRTSKYSAKEHAMDRSVPPFWNLEQDEDETATGGLPASAHNAPPYLANLSEFFGALSPAGDANQQLPESPAGAGVLDCSGHAMKRSAGGAAEADGAIEEGEEKSGLYRRRKRRRNSEMHNLNERRRRDRLSEKMRTLRSLVPNSQKLDRAALLDKAIEYMKSLQQLLQIMSDSKQCPPPLTPQPAIRCSPLPHFPLFPAVNPSLNMAYGGMAPPSMPSPCSSLPWTSYAPLSSPSSVAQFQAPMAVQYWPCNVPPQEFPVQVENAAVSAQASQAQAAPPHSLKEAESRNLEVTGELVQLKSISSS